MLTENQARELGPISQQEAAEARTVVIHEIKRAFLGDVYWQSFFTASEGALIRELGVHYVKEKRKRPDAPVDMGPLLDTLTDARKTYINLVARMARVAVQDARALRRVESTPKLEIRLQDNPQMQPRGFSSKDFSFHEEGGAVIEYYRGKRYREYSKGNLKYLQLAGQKKSVIFNTDPNAPHAGYVPSRDTYVVGEGARSEFNKDPSQLFSTFLHEAAHEVYFKLEGKQQRDLTDLFLRDPVVGTLLGKFARALYTDPYTASGQRTAGQDYLAVHSIQNTNMLQNTICNDGEPGLKDTRSFSVDLHGGKTEVLAGLVVTEFISYLSSHAVGKRTAILTSEHGKNIRNGDDPRYDVIQAFYTYLRTNGSFRETFDRLGLFKANTEDTKEQLQVLFTNSR